MNLVSVLGKENPGLSQEFVNQFKGSEKPVHLQLGEEDRIEQIEVELGRMGADLYDIDTFLVIDDRVKEKSEKEGPIPSKWSKGETISRNSLNYGIIKQQPGTGRIKIGDSYLEPGYIHKLPYHGNVNALVVAVDPDNELVPTIAKGHYLNGDEVRILAVKGWDKPGWKQEMERIYNGLIFRGWKDKSSEPPYRFLEIPDKELEKNTNKFEDALGEYLDSENPPNVVIQICPGKNHDHNVAYDITKKVVSSKKRINLLWADGIEHADTEPEGMDLVFKPTLFQAVSGKELERAMELYEFRRTIPYIDQVSDLLRKRQAGLSKLLSYAKTKYKSDMRWEDPEKFKNLSDYLNKIRSRGSLIDWEPTLAGSFGLQPEILYIDNQKGIGYSIPHMFDFKELRRLTK